MATEFNYLGNSIPDSEVDLIKRIGQEKKAWLITKKACLFEIMNYVSNPNEIAEAIVNIPPDLEDYQNLGVVHMELDA